MIKVHEERQRLRKQNLVVRFTYDPQPWVLKILIRETRGGRRRDDVTRALPSPTKSTLLVASPSVAYSLAPTSEQTKPRVYKNIDRSLVCGAATYLSHTAWYARVAAASCLESLARLEYEQEEPPSSPSGTRKEGGGDTLTDELATGWVGLGDVRLAEVLERGALLLSHGDDVSDGRGRR